MNLFADDGRISGKTALEKAPREQDHALTLRLVFGCREDAAEGRSYTQK